MPPRAPGLGCPRLNPPCSTRMPSHAHMLASLALREEGQICLEKTTACKNGTGIQAGAVRSCRQRRRQQPRPRPPQQLKLLHADSHNPNISDCTALALCVLTSCSMKARGSPAGALAAPPPPAVVGGGPSPSLPGLVCPTRGSISARLRGWKAPKVSLTERRGRKEAKVANNAADKAGCPPAGTACISCLIPCFFNM